MPTKIGSNNSSTIEETQKLQERTGDLQIKQAPQPKFSRRKVFLSRLKRRFLKHVWLARLALIAGFLLVVAATLIVVNGVFKNTKTGLYISLAKNFLLTPRDEINSVNGRTNIPILGKGGEGHEAPDLTDTMIFASLEYKSSTKPFGLGDMVSISMFSLPRDIWVYDLRTKLNSTYYWGNQKQPDGGGLILAKSVVEEVVGQPIQYAIVIDFSGFEKIINVLGGIQVDVAASFTDSEYPIAGKENDLCSGDPEFKCRYETLSFEKGPQYMDGATALKFVRSRHAKGDEGTDFARAARQERVIKAIKEKVLSKDVYLNPKKVIELKDAVLASIETDITPGEAAILTRWFIGAQDNIDSYVLSENYLEVAPKSLKYDNLYVFVPEEIDETEPSGRSWIKVHDWIGCLLEGGACN